MDKAGALTLDERMVLDALLPCKGRSQAIKMREIESLTGMKNRCIRKTIQHLIVEHAFPIGSVSRPPYGYYLCIVEQDFEAAYKERISRAIELLRDARALKGSSQLAEILGQLSLLQSR